MSASDWHPSYTLPAYTYTNTSSSTMLWPQQQYYVNDISFNPATAFNPPAAPAKPASDMDWLRRMNDDICALAGL